MRNILSLLLVVSAVISASSHAQQDWELRRDRDGIKVYTSKVSGSPYAAVKTVAVMEDVQLSSLVALLEDPEACPDWADKCAESFVYQRLSATESYVYTHNDMPFPVKDRDHLAHVRWSQDPDTLTVMMQSSAVTGLVEEQPGRLRLKAVEVSWTFSPKSSGAVEISNQAHIDPGSALPGWLTNMLLIDTPFQTMQSFMDEVRRPKYRDASVQFIVEPDTRQNSATLATD